MPLCYPLAHLREVTFQDMRTEKEHKVKKTCQLQVYQKIKWTCKQAKADGLKYAWVDTCCMNNQSSAELSEAINSMY